MLFKKRMSKESVWKDKVAMKVVNLLLKMQVKFSKVMSSLTKTFSVKRLKVLLVIFCLLGGGTSIYLVAEAIFKDEQPALKIEKIKLPEFYNQDSDLPTEKTIDPESYEALQSFRRYMDSVQKVRFDSVLKLKLTDSLKKINSKIKL